MKKQGHFCSQQVMRKCKSSTFIFPLVCKNDWYKHYMKRRTSEKLPKWRFTGSALEEDLGCDGTTMSEETWKPGRSWRNGPPTGRDGKVSARPATLHMETAVKCEKLYETHKSQDSSQHFILIYLVFSFVKNIHFNLGFAYRCMRERG